MAENKRVYLVFWGDSKNDAQVTVLSSEAGAKAKAAELTQRGYKTAMEMMVLNETEIEVEKIEWSRKPRRIINGNPRN